MLKTEILIFYCMAKLMLGKFLFLLHGEIAVGEVAVGEISGGEIAVGEVVSGKNAGIEKRTVMTT